MRREQLDVRQIDDGAVTKVGVRLDSSHLGRKGARRMRLPDRIVAALVPPRFPAAGTLAIPL